MNELYYNSALERINYDSICNNKELCVKRTKRYVYKYIIVTASSDTFNMPKEKLIHFIPYNQYSFSSKSTKVILIKEIVLDIAENRKDFH